MDKIITDLRDRIDLIELDDSKSRKIPSDEEISQFARISAQRISTDQALALIDKYYGKQFGMK
jgi:hypothetical protein